MGLKCEEIFEFDTRSSTIELIKWHWWEIHHKTLKFPYVTETDGNNSKKNARDEMRCNTVWIEITQRRCGRTTSRKRRNDAKRLKFQFPGTGTIEFLWSNWKSYKAWAWWFLSFEKTSAVLIVLVAAREPKSLGEFVARGRNLASYDAYCNFQL